MNIQNIYLQLQEGLNNRYLIFEVVPIFIK